MPIELTIDHDARALRAVCTDVVGLADVEAYFDAVTVAGAKFYGKLFDIGDADLRLSDRDIQLLGARIRAYADAGGEPFGPVAVVANSREAHESAELFTALADARRPLEIFRHLSQARQWLATRSADALEADAHPPE